MKRVKIRHDLMSKSKYSREYRISRPTIDDMIENGLLDVERIDDTDYIKLGR